jgi:uncharacterized protein YndB with AHSA1/START domain
MHITDITAPNTLRFTVGWTNHGERRMGLQEFHYDEEEKSNGLRTGPRNCLFFKADYDQITKWWGSARCAEKSARLGSRRRYRQEVEIAREIVAHLGWTLTPDEESLLQVIEAYGAEHAAERAAA